MLSSVDLQHIMFATSMADEVKGALLACQEANFLHQDSGCLMSGVVPG